MTIDAPKLDTNSLSLSDRNKLRTFHAELENGNLERVESSRQTYVARFAGTPLAAYAFYDACIHEKTLTAMALLRADSTLDPDGLSNDQGLSALAYAKASPAFRPYLAEMEKRAAAMNAAQAMAAKDDSNAVSSDSRVPAPIIPDQPKLTAIAALLEGHRKTRAGLPIPATAGAAVATDRVVINGGTSATTIPAGLGQGENSATQLEAFLRNFNADKGQAPA